VASPDNARKDWKLVANSGQKYGKIVAARLIECGGVSQHRNRCAKKATIQVFNASYAV
jgi:hypothetical protein